MRISRHLNELLTQFKSIAFVSIRIRKMQFFLLETNCGACDAHTHALVTFIKSSFEHIKIVWGLEIMAADRFFVARKIYFFSSKLSK